MIKKFPASIISALILLTCFSPLTAAQYKIGAGLNLGGGTISGNFIKQGAFTSSFFVEAKPGTGSNFLLRLSFLYITDENILLTQSYGRYNPFIKGFSLKGSTSQSMSHNLYVEESLGPLLLNDRTYENINEWDFGVAFSLLGGLDLRDKNENGFKVGVGVEYGLTFTNSDVRYLSLHLQLEYML